MCLNGMKLLILYQGCQRSAVILISPRHGHTCAQECACGQSRTGSGPAGRAPITVHTTVLLPLPTLSWICSYFSDLFFGGSLLHIPQIISSQSGVQRPWGALETFSGKTGHRNYVHNNKMLFVFSTLILSRVHSGVFQRPRDVGYGHRSNADVQRGIRLQRELQNIQNNAVPLVNFLF